MSIIGNPITLGGGKPTIPFDTYSQFTEQGLTGSAWTSDDGTKSVTLAAGTWAVENGKFIANGSTRLTVACPSSSIMFGLRFSVDSSFTPASSSQWYNQSCLMGGELAGAQRDCGITIVKYNNQLYPCIGYGESSYARSPVPIQPDTEYDIFLLWHSSIYSLYLDGTRVTNVTYGATGTNMTKLGVFWNAGGTGSTVKGTISAIGVYTFDYGKMPLPSFK